MFSKPCSLIRSSSLKPGWHIAAALAGFLAFALPMSANAEPGDEECFRLFYKWGHWPTEPNCPLSTSTTPVGPGTFYCTGTGGAVDRFCMNDIVNSGGPGDPLIPSTPEQCTTFVGNPINAGNENKYQYEVDIEGSESMPLTFARHYNSISGFGDPVLGSSWRHTYSRRLHVSDPLAATAVTSAERADGKVWQFKRAVDGTWPPISDDIIPRLVELKTGSTRTGWELRDFTANIVERYNVDGRLEQIAKAGGAALTLAYDGIGRLSSVTDAITGRQITFQYDDATNLMASVTGPDGQTHAFGYDAEFPPNLVSVTRPDETPGNSADNPVRTYVYDEPEYSADTTMLKHLLTAILDERGNRYATYFYDEDRRAIGSTHAGGADAYGLAYSGNASTFDNPLGAQTTLNFTTIAGRRVPVSASQPACLGGLATRNFIYDARTNLVEQQDFRGTRTCSTYETNRRVETIRVEGLSTTCPGNLSTYAPPAPALATDNVAVRKTTTQWHPFWYLKIREAAPKRITTWVYNGQPDPTNSNAILSCAPSGAMAAGQPIAVLCKSIEQATTDETGGQGFSATTTGTARIWQYTYNASGQRLTANGPRTDVTDTTAFAYYTATDLSGCNSGGNCRRVGDLWTITNALNQVVEFQNYDRAGRVTRTRDKNGTTTDLAYTARGWLRQFLVRASTGGSPSSSDATTIIEYEPTGEIRKVTDPDGAYRRYEYDAARRLTNVVDTLNNRMQFTLDAAGNRITEKYYDNTYNPPNPLQGLKRTLTREYDRLSRLKRVRDALSRPVVTYQRSLSTQNIADGYDDNGNLLHTIDGLGVEQEIAYDALNRTTQAIRDYLGPDTDTQNTTTKIAYDGRGSLRAVTDAVNLVTTYTVDGLGRQLQVQSPDTGTTVYTFDAAGNRLTTTDNKSATRSFGYDVLNRLTSITYPTSSLNVTFTYDEANVTTGCTDSFPVGRLTRMTDGSGQTIYCYDRRGNVLKKTQTTSGKTLVVGYTYTKADRLESVVYPSGGTALYTRDSDGRITGIGWKGTPTSATTNIVFNVAYKPFGPVTGMVFGNGRSLGKVYDANYIIDDIVSSSTGGLNLDLTTDVLGNVVAGGEDIGGPPSHKYVYDRLYRLSRVDDASNTMIEDYAHNKSGDRLSKQFAGQPLETYAYTPGTHHIASIAGTNRSYDLNGNTTDLGDGVPLVYDDHNRLKETGAGITYSFKYSGRGERVMTTADSLAGGRINRRYIYGSGGKLLALSNYNTHDAGAGQVENLYLDNVPVAQISNGSIVYLETDHAGTPRVAVDALTNTTISAWSFFGSAFGEHGPDGSYDGILRFPGQLVITDGLFYNYFRDYEPATGRYLQSDPIGLGGGIDTYSYAIGNPFNFIDPLGLKTLCEALREILTRADSNPFLNGTPFDRNNLGGEDLAGSADGHFVDERNGLEYDIQYTQVAWSIANTYGVGSPQLAFMLYYFAPAISGDLEFYATSNLAANLRGLDLGDFAATHFSTFADFVNDLCPPEAESGLCRQP